MEEWRYISFSQHDAFENMAIDEAIFRGNQRRNMFPTLRFYGWMKPSVSLGYFQDVKNEVNLEFCRDKNIRIVRRPTGGKAVMHEKDLTYSVVAQEKNPLFPPGLLGTYRVISGCIASGLAKLGINADLAQQSRSAESSCLQSFCFSTPSQYELLVNGRKICGSAQMRSKGVFLQHGSLLMDFNPQRTYSAIGKSTGDITTEISNLEKQVTSIYEHIDPKINSEELCQLLASGFEECLGIRLVRGRLTREERRLKEQLLRYKYMSSNWNMKGKAVEWRSKEP